MLPTLGELTMILLVIFLIFGLGRMPQISRQLAQGVRAFKRELNEPSTQPADDTPKAHEAALRSAQAVEDATLDEASAVKGRPPE